MILALIIAVLLSGIIIALLTKECPRCHGWSVVFMAGCDTCHGRGLVWKNHVNH